MSSVTLEDTVRRYLNQVDNPNTRLSYARILEPFARDYGPRRLLVTVTTTDIETWSASQRAGLATATIMSRRKTMKVFWNWCVRHQLIDHSPAKSLKVKKLRGSMVNKAIPGEIVVGMLAEVRRKREQFTRVRDTAILALLTTYGARAGDIARLPVANINLKDQWIVLHVKGDNEIRLPLPPDTAALLHEWLKLRRQIVPNPPHEFVFTNIRSRPGQCYGPLAPGSISKLVERLSVSVCGIAHGPHSVRHWVGQHLADQRVPPTIVQTILGHSSVHITLEYYYDQDYDRVKSVLEKTELAHQICPEDPAPDNKKPKILHVDFGHAS